MNRRNFVKHSFVSPFATGILLTGIVAANGQVATQTCFPYASGLNICRVTNTTTGLQCAGGTAANGGGDPCTVNCKTVDGGTPTCDGPT